MNYERSHVEYLDETHRVTLNSRISRFIERIVRTGKYYEINKLHGSNIDTRVRGKLTQARPQSFHG